MTTPLPPGVDWRKADAVRINVDGVETGGWGTTTELTEVIKEFPGHPDDTYRFQSVGWLDPDEVAARNGKTFPTTCTRAPGLDRHVCDAPAAANYGTWAHSRNGSETPGSWRER